MSAVLISMAHISNSINAVFVTPFSIMSFYQVKDQLKIMIKIVLTKHFVSYPKKEKWKKSSSPYSSMKRIMNNIEFKPT